MLAYLIKICYHFSSLDKEALFDPLVQNKFSYPKEYTKKHIKSSTNFKNNKAQNKEPIKRMTKIQRQNIESKIQNQIFQTKPKNLLRELLSPDKVVIPSVKSDLLQIPKEDSFVWFGHSSLFFWLNSKTLLIDPVLKSCASPIPFLIKPFSGADIYSASDLPKIDYLFITHNHYDHLSKSTIKALVNKIGHVITPLGVGKYLIKFGIKPCQIYELDWDESLKLDSTLRTHCLTTRHFSGRGIFDRNKSLWASFMLESKDKKIFLSGDGGYGMHFKAIGKKFKYIDFAFIENGQYNIKWAQVHSFPKESLQALKDLNVKKAMPIHNSKFKISTHNWRDPLDSLLALYNKDENINFALLTPKIGEITPLWRDINTPRWWQEIKS